MMIPSPCSSIGGDSVIFVAEGLSDSGDGWGNGPGRVAIIEPLQNVPRELKEVTVATGAGTSCYRPIRTGEQYVIITSGPRYSIAACNGSFELKGNEHILDAMRNQLRGGGPGLAGIVRRSTGRYSHGTGVSNARVELRNGEARHEAITDGEGRYAISNLEAVRYKILVSKEGYVPDDEFNNRSSDRLAIHPKTNKIEPVKDVPGEIEIMGQTCTIRDLALWPSGSIRGTVRGVEGKPLPGVPVEAFPVNEKGRQDSRALRTAVTDSQGQYILQPLPAGQFVVGVNARLHEDTSAYPPGVYAGGRPISLGEVARVEGIDLALGAPRTAARLRVRAVNAIGRPLQGARVWLEAPGGKERWSSREHTNAEGELIAPVYTGEEYIVRVSHYETGNGIRSISGRARIAVDQGETNVTVVLQAER